MGRAVGIDKRKWAVDGTTTFIWTQDGVHFNPTGAAAAAVNEIRPAIDALVYFG